jgi:hypothetical protein
MSSKNGSMLLLSHVVIWGRFLPGKAAQCMKITA